MRAMNKRIRTKYFKLEAEEVSSKFSLTSDVAFFDEEEKNVVKEINSLWSLIHQISTP